LEKLIKAGAVVYGLKPLQSNSLLNYPDCDQEVKKLGEKIWGNCDGITVKSNNYGKGKVYYGMPLWQVMKAEGVEQDFKAEGFDNSDQHIDYIHRRTSREDFYFVSNSNLTWQKFTARFRISSDKTPYLWHADDGSIESCKVVDAGPEFTTLEMNLPPAGSVFVVFQPKEEADPASLVNRNFGVENRNEPVASPDKPWKITFPEGRGAPKELVLNELADWTLSSIDGVKYFSGTAAYSTTLTIADAMLGNPDGLILDLGEVREVAVVKLNGSVVDTLWKQPYQVPISKFAKSGINQLVVEVTNLWHNRLVGDAGKLSPERFTKTNIQTRYKPDMLLLPSGLIGPVTLKFGVK
jgi:hypothetical protein